MVRSIPLLAALFWVLLVLAAPAEGFIRVEESEDAARLQTAVTRFEKDGGSVELIGAVHIADKAYYQALTERFTGYDSLLFEMIGGDNRQSLPTPEAAAAQKPSGLRQIYAMAAKFLKLTGQTENIDYTARNFVHADLSLDEFQTLQSQRGESIIGFALAAGNQDAANPPTFNSTRLLAALMLGNANRIKLEIVHTLGNADDQIAAFAGESVIITDRNARCFEVMARELAAGHKKLGIFYGAAHFPDMEKRLLALGFKRTGQEWLTAWDIPKKASKKPAAETKEPS